MKRRILTLLAVLAVLVGALSVVGQAAATETLSGYTDSKTISEDTVLNMAGNSIGTLTVESGVTVTLQNMGNGTIGSIEGEGTVVLTDTTETSVTIKGTVYDDVEVNYLNFEDGQLLLGNAGVSLSSAPADVVKYGASAYYTSVFSGNDAVRSKIADYGVALGAGRVPNFAEKTYTDHDGVMTGWTTGGAFTDNGVRLTNIMGIGKAYTLNKIGSTKRIYNVAYVKLSTGTRITSNPNGEKEITLKNMVAGMTASDRWATYSYTQKTNLISFYNTFEDVMESWPMGSVEPLVKKAAGETYAVYNADDVKLMSAVTGANVQLMASIDMEGAAIDGLTNFTGSFYGNGNTLSNMTINGIGLVDSVAAGETVSNLHLRDVTVVVPTGSKATAVGTIAGTNNGTITGVTASGFVKDANTPSEETYYGALVGKNTATITPGTADLVNENKLGQEDRKILKAGASQTEYSVPGENHYKVLDSNGAIVKIAASVGFDVADTKTNTGLVGTGYSNANVYWRDHSNNTAASVVGEKEYSRRIEASQYMNELGSISWTTNTPLKYIKSTTDNSHIHNQTLSTGVTYYGTPYAHSSSPLEQAKFALGYTDAFGNTDNNATAGVLRAEFAQLAMENGYGVYYNSNRTGVGQWIGNDCSSAVAMAWQRVSSAYFSATAPGVKLLLTQSMVPSQQNQKSFNFQIVGDYTVDDETMVHKSQLYKNSLTGNIVEGPVTGGTGFLYTEYDEYQARYFKVGGLTETITVDGEQKTQNINFPLMGTTNIVDATDANSQRVNSDTTIYESYAQTAMGDIMIMAQPSVDHKNGTYSLAGHAMLVVGDPVTIRNGNGDIDAAKSFMIISEQGAGLYDKNINSSWRVNVKYSYQMLLKGPAGLTEDATFSHSESGMRAYLPITMRAYKSTANIANMCYGMERRTAIQEAVKAGATPATFTYNVAPNKAGNFNSNHRILNATLKIWDYETYGETCPEDANLLYKKTSWQSAIVPSTSDRFNRMRGYRIPLDMNDHFADYASVFTTELGFGKGLTEGNTYAYTVSFTLSNGEVINGFMDTNLPTYNRNCYTFEYTAPAA